MKNIRSIILAAGEGTRFKSDTPKVLHRVLGKTMLERVFDTVRDLADKTIVVVGHKAGAVRESIPDKSVVFVEQKKQLGSGDAVKQAETALKNFTGDVVVLCGDTPLLRKETIKELVAFHKKNAAVCTVLTCDVGNPFGYGRIVRCGGNVSGIVEEKDASDEIKKIKEINTGTYVFSSRELFGALKKVKSNNAKKEYYLTDVISILNSEGKKVSAYKTCWQNYGMGINNRCELAVAEGIARKRILDNLMLSGVSIVDPATVYIDESVEIERDTVILPSTIIKGKTKIKTGSVIGPFSYIEDSSIGQNVEVKASFVYGAEIAEDVKIGPYSHIRKETKIAAKAKIGNFSEIKKSYIGVNTKVSHLSYIGDSHLEKNINVGAGTITCNYDGKNKHQTKIGEGSFIGSNTNLVAPVIIGKGVLIAAGSTVTDDVPDGVLVIARSRQVVKEKKKK